MYSFFRQHCLCGQLCYIVYDWTVPLFGWKEKIKILKPPPLSAKIPAARTDHLLCADTNDLGEISAPRVRINNTLVGGILDFRSVKCIIETRRANQQLVGLRFQWTHEAHESVPKLQKIDCDQCNLSQDWKKMHIGHDYCAVYVYSEYLHQTGCEINPHDCRQIFYIKCSKLSN